MFANGNRMALYMAVFFGAARLATLLPFISGMTVIWTALAAIYLVYVLWKDKDICISASLTAFCLIALLGLIIKRPPVYFRAFERLVAFSINIALLSPFILTPTLCDFRRKLFTVTRLGLGLIVLASFVAYLFGFSLAPRNPHDVYWVFCGVTSDSLLLSPCRAVCALDCMWHIIVKDTNARSRLAFGLMLAISVWTMLVSGSRGAILACTVGFVVLIVYARNPLRVLLISVAVAALVFCAAPHSLKSKAVHSISIKQDNSRANNSITFSRDALWQSRIMEFKENPVWGVGFASQQRILGNDRMEKIYATGIIEPGSSWLGVLSMTGMLGFLALGTFMFKLLMILIHRSKVSEEYVLMFSLFVCMSVYGIVEGWIFAAGSFLFFFFWLLTGNICRDSKHEIKLGKQKLCRLTL